ncbi:MAG: helix-turn-helix domain-containing protein [Roseiflexaceae bacterium]|nr:helix-turn-helix domain-containing protein [Roseiflexaceae bacterium]
MARVLPGLELASSGVARDVGKEQAYLGGKTMTAFHSLDRATERSVSASPLLGSLVAEQRIEDVITGFRRDRAPAARRQVPAHQPELKHRFIYSLLHTTNHDEPAILREASLLGMDFTPPRAVLLIDAAVYILAPGAGGYDAAAEHQLQRAQQVIRAIVRFFRLPNDTICAYIGNGEVVVLKASDSKNLIMWAHKEDWSGQGSPLWMNLRALERAGEELLGHLRHEFNDAVCIGIGRHHAGVRGLARSYQDAQAALSLGRHFCSAGGVYCLDRLGIAAFIGISDDQTKADLATFLLSPLDHEPELLHTLNVFFAEDCLPSATAQRLNIHRNTLSYRLEKTASLLGLHPRRFDDAVQIRLALMLRQYRATSS